MTDEHLDELSRELFQAARAERPDSLLEPRVIARAGSELRARRPETRAARWLVAAIVLASGAALFWLAQPRERSDVAISPEILGPDPARDVTGPAATPEAAVASERGLEKPSELARDAVSARPKPSVTQSTLAQPEAAKAPTAAPPSSERAEPTSLADEIGRLKRAREALRAGQAARALELLQPFESTRSALGAEATLLRLDALRALGRHDEAATLAGRFIAEQTDSPLSERAQTFLRPATAPKRASPSSE
jgi:hypothetical protein